MGIDWLVLATIAGPIIGGFVAVWLDRRWERRPRLISYVGHVSAVRFHPSEGATLQIHTHSVVLRNAGRRAAANVRVHHLLLPDFSIWPSLQHYVEEFEDGTKDIVIPRLVPGEQITISYLYFPPTLANHINASIKSDDGFAQFIPMLLQRQWPRWFGVVSGVFMLLGLVWAVYLVYRAVAALLH